MEKTLKVLMIGSDRKLFAEGSAVLERIKEYGALVDELHIVVLAKNILGLKDKKISDNVWIYPTNSWTRWLYVSDATRIGKKIVFDHKFIRGQSLITTQDPFECGWVGMKIKKRWRLPLEVQLHTDPYSPYFKGFLNKIRKIISKKILKRADSIRVVSEHLKLKARNYNLTASITVLPIYIDKNKIEAGQVTFDLHTRYGWRFVILSVARLTPEKNLSLAIKILALVRRKYPETGLVIVGSGPEENRLKLLAKKLGLTEHVVFAGWHDNLYSFYKTANAFIQTSIFEGYGLALIEAGLLGLPVITTPVGIATELKNDEEALIYPQNNPEMFANGVVTLIENNYKRESLRTNLKSALEAKLISKDDYMARIKDGWEKTSKKIK